MNGPPDRGPSRGVDEGSGNTSRPRTIATRGASQRLVEGSLPKAGDFNGSRLASLAVALLGGAVAVVGVTLYGGTGIRLHIALVGLLVCSSGLYNWYRLQNGMGFSVGVGSIVSVLGCWLVVAAGFGGLTGPRTTFVVTAGLLVVAVSSYTVFRALAGRSKGGGRPGD